MAISVTRTRSARDYHTQQTHFLYQRVRFDSFGITTTNKCYVGVLPADCLPLETIVRVNSTGAQGVVIGTSISSSSFVGPDDLIEASTVVGANVVITDRCANTARSTVDLPVYALMSTAGTNGEWDVWVRYLPTKG
jgi:UDP-3-O-[3-hydroxymyristoyl] glucosamine N-acyltransferase